MRVVRSAIFALLVGVAGLPGTCAAAADDPGMSTGVAAQVRDCRAMADDAVRLRCYDAVAAGRGEDIVSLRPSEGQAPAPPGEDDASPARHGLRIDVGYSAALGNYTGSSKVSGGTLTSKSATGGLGGGMLAEAWLDHWPAKDLSVGLEYMQINNRGELNADLPRGVSILTDPVYAHLGLALRTDTAFFNLAYRPHTSGRVRPILGAGLGVGYGTAVENNLISNAFIGADGNESRTHFPFAGLQAFAGVEANLTDRIYLSMIPRVFAVSAHPIGKNQRYLDFVLGANLGYRFR